LFTSAELLELVKNTAFVVFNWAAGAIDWLVGGTASVCSLGRSLALSWDCVGVQDVAQLSGGEVKGAVLVRVDRAALLAFEGTASEVVASDPEVPVIADLRRKADGWEGVHNQVVFQVAVLSSVARIALEAREWAAFAVSRASRRVGALNALCASGLRFELRATSRDVVVDYLAFRGGKPSFILGVGLLALKWAALAVGVLRVETRVALGESAGLRAASGDSGEVRNLGPTNGDAEILLGVGLAFFTGHGANFALSVHVLVQRGADEHSLRDIALRSARDHFLLLLRASHWDVLLEENSFIVAELSAVLVIVALEAELGAAVALWGLNVIRARARGERAVLMVLVLRAALAGNLGPVDNVVGAVSAVVNWVALASFNWAAVAARSPEVVIRAGQRGATAGDSASVERVLAWAAIWDAGKQNLASCIAELTTVGGGALGALDGAAVAVLADDVIRRAERG